MSGDGNKLKMLSAVLAVINVGFFVDYMVNANPNTLIVYLIAIVACKFLYLIAKFFDNHVKSNRIFIAGCFAVFLVLVANAVYLAGLVSGHVLAFEALLPMIATSISLLLYAFIALEYGKSDDKYNNIALVLLGLFAVGCIFGLLTLTVFPELLVILAVPITVLTWICNILLAANAVYTGYQAYKEYTSAAGNSCLGAPLMIPGRGPNASPDERLLPPGYSMSSSDIGLEDGSSHDIPLRSMTI